MIRLLASLVLDLIAAVLLSSSATYIAHGDTGVWTLFIGVEGLGLAVYSATLSVGRR